jgi:hypothetical protein
MQAGYHLSFPASYLKRTCRLPMQRSAFVRAAILVGPAAATFVATMCGLEAAFLSIGPVVDDQRAASTMARRATG